MRRGEGGLAAVSPKDSKNHGLVPQKDLLDRFFGRAMAIWFRFFIWVHILESRCSDTEKPFRAEDGPATLQPRGEFYEGRAGPAGADSPKGN